MENLVKYCYECGEPLPHDDDKYCHSCGSKLSLPCQEGYLNDIVERTVDKKICRASNKHRYSYDIGIFLIILGIAILLAVYLVPAYTVTQPMIIGSQPSTISFSIAQIHSFCSIPLAGTLTGNICSTYDIFFYIGWILAIICFIMGIFSFMISMRR